MYQTGDRLEMLPDVQASLKALIARKIWGMTAYYLIINSANDPVYDRAVQLLEDPAAYDRLLAPAADR